MQGHGTGRTIPGGFEDLGDHRMQALVLFGHHCSLAQAADLQKPCRWWSGAYRYKREREREGASETNNLSSSQ